MDVRNLLYFCCVAEQRSFSKAATQLRIGQPALSKAIQKLESDLGVHLFDRSGRVIQLTPEGVLLAQNSRDLIDRFDQLRDTVRAHAPQISGIVRVAVPPAAGQLIAPRLTLHLGQHYPGIRVDFVEGLSADIHEMLLLKGASLGVIHDPIPHRDLKSWIVLSEEMFLVGRAEMIDGLANPESIRTIASLPLILPSRPNSRRLLVERVFREHGHPITLRSEVDGYSIVCALLQAGEGYSILTEGVAERFGSLKSVVIREPGISWPLSLISHRERLRDRASAAVIECLRQVIRELVDEGAWGGNARYYDAPALGV